MNPDVAKLSEITEAWNRYEEILGLLYWDNEVMMPSGGTDARARLLSFVSVEHHEAIVDPAIGALLRTLEEEKLEGQEQAIFTKTKFAYDRARKVPAALVHELAETETKAVFAWRDAKEKSDFSVFAPHLRKIIELHKRVAAAIDPGRDPYQVMLEGYDQSLQVDNVRVELEKVKAAIVPLVRAIGEKKQLDSSVLDQKMPLEKQVELNKLVAETLGFDFTVGRLDISTHPFSVYDGDLRITTRYRDDFWHGAGSTAHEVGHALYEHGIDRSLPAPLNKSASLVVHESQSRLWENHVVKSRNWLGWLAPKLRDFGIAITGEEFYTAVNRVERSFIRVDADEVTYPLHIILRFTIEQEIVRGQLDVDDIPSRWNALMQELVGVTPPNDGLGCLQDIHWSSGFAYFPTYALGSMLAAQLFAAARKDVPSMDELLAKGETAPLLQWLREHVHKHGDELTTEELVLNATGKPFAADDYIEYLKAKYKELYALH